MTSINPELKKVVANHAELHDHLTTRLRPHNLPVPFLWSWRDATLLSIAQTLSASLFDALCPRAQKALRGLYKDTCGREPGTDNKHVLLQYVRGVCMHIDKRQVTRLGKHYGIFVGWDADNCVVYEYVHRLVAMLTYGFNDTLVDKENEQPAKDHHLDGEGPPAAIHRDYDLKCSSSCINAHHIHWFPSGANTKAHWLIRHPRRRFYRGPKNWKNTDLNFKSLVRDLLSYRGIE